MGGGAPPCSHPIAAGDDNPAHRPRTECGTSWYFVRAGCARWYAMDHEGDHHFTRAESADIESAIEEGAAVLLTGFHARPIRLWETWAAFADDVKGGNR